MEKGGEFISLFCSCPDSHRETFAMNPLLDKIVIRVTNDGNKNNKKCFQTMV